MRFTKQKIDEINTEINKLNDKLKNISESMNDIVRLVLSEGESDSASTNDNVNHPSHYETGNFECIDVMVETQGKEAVMDFCVCNAFKYITVITTKMELKISKKQNGIWINILSCQKNKKAADLRLNYLQSIPVRFSQSG